MEYPVKETVLRFSDTLGTIKAIEALKKKSFMAIVASSYSTTGVCIASLDDMTDVLGVAYADAQVGRSRQESIKELLEFMTTHMSYQEIFQMYDKLLISLQYSGKSDEEIEELIAKNLERAEARRKRILAKVKEE